MNSGSRAFLETRAFRQQRGPSNAVVLTIGVGALVFGALHSPTHGNTRFMHSTRIARYERVPPIKIAPLRDQFVAATRRQPVQGADVLRGQPDAVRNQFGPVCVILASA